MEYKQPSIRFISDRLNDNLVDSLFNAMCNISSLIGDIDGKISTTTANASIRYIDIEYPGKVMLLSDYVPVEDTSSPVEIPSYISECSISCWNVFQDIKAKQGVLQSEDVTTSSIDTPLLYLSNHLDEGIQGALGVVYLETIAVYRDLLSSNPVMSSWDIDRNISNCIRVSYDIENSYTEYDLVLTIRNLQKNLMYIKYITKSM